MTDIKKITVDWNEYWSYDAGVDIKKNFFATGTTGGIIDDENSIFHDKLLWDVFIHSMAIGRHYNERTPLVKHSNSLPVKYLKIEQISMILGVVFSLDGKEKGEEKIDLSILNEPRQIQTICQEYANAGVERLIEFEKIRDSDNPISEYEKSFKMLLEEKK